MSGKKQESTPRQGQGVWRTYEGGGSRAEAGEGQQSVPRLLHAHYDIMLRVQEGSNQLQAVALQHLDVQGHALGVALHCPYLRAEQRMLHCGFETQACGVTLQRAHLTAGKIWHCA